MEEPSVQPLQHAVPNPEVSEKPVRRQFTADYKARILDEADACNSPGQLGELLRREGLYSSHLTTWRKQRQHGAHAALAPKRRGRQASTKNPLTQENERLKRENQRLQDQLRQAELISDVQKKISELLGIPLKNRANDENA